MHYLAAIDLSVDRVDASAARRSSQVIPTWRYLSTAGVAPDPEIQAVVER